MANLCGHVPLALRLLVFHLKDTDPAKLVEWLQGTPLEVLQAPNEKVTNAMEKCFLHEQKQAKELMVEHFLRVCHI